MGSVDGNWSDLPIDPDLDTDEEAAGPRHRPPRVGPGTVLAVALGGVVGAVARYALAVALPAVAGGFPWGTFLVNVSGSAVLGVVVAVLAERLPHNHLARPLVVTGVIGAYTTFSTYVVEADLLVKDGHPLTAVVYVVASAVVGLAAVWAGMVAARSVLAGGVRVAEEEAS